MPRILTGIQSTNVPHLGNLLGAILPGIALSQDASADAFFFIADLHALTTVREPALLRESTYSVAAAWLACGFDTTRGTFYRQSDVPSVTELAWYLSCHFPYSRAALAHSFKDKSDRLEQVNVGLFTYPMLMAADILAYDANVVPVGKDQLQHLEFTRDVAERMQATYGEMFVLPEAKIAHDSMNVPGTDGEKMSKSRGNTIVIFEDDKTLKKQVMSIATDSTPLESPKDPAACNVFGLFALLASPSETEDLRSKYLAGNYGYGHAKKELLDVIMARFAHTRSEYARYMNDRAALDRELLRGSEKAKAVSGEVLRRVRQRLGYL